MIRDVLSQPEHGGSFVKRMSNGEWHALFVRDVLGRLVWTPEPSLGAGCPFNDTSVPLDFKEDSVAPMPWHWTRQDFVDALNLWIEEAPRSLETTFKKLYPRMEPAMVPYLYSRSVRASISDDELLKVIESLTDPTVEAGLRTGVIARLAEFGVTPIPHIALFTEIYHQARDGIELRRWQPVETLTHGWMRDGRALIPSEVTVKSTSKR